MPPIVPILPIWSKHRCINWSNESNIQTPERDEKQDTVMHVLRSFDVNKPGTKLKNIKGGVIGDI